MAGCGRQPELPGNLTVRGRVRCGVVSLVEELQVVGIDLEGFVVAGAQDLAVAEVQGPGRDAVVKGHIV